MYNPIALQLYRIVQAQILKSKYMEYRKMGKTGLQLSTLSFGSWVTFHKQIDDRVADELMGIAYDAGVNFFDNAEVYAAGEKPIPLADGRSLVRGIRLHGNQNAVLANAFIIENIPYYWKKGKIEKWKN